MEVKMTVQSRIKIFQLNGEDVGLGSETSLFVNSVWNKKEFVEIEIFDKRAVVFAPDLIKAIANATNNRD
jgi:hypothetical protein